MPYDFLIKDRKVSEFMSISEKETYLEQNHIFSRKSVDKYNKWYRYQKWWMERTTIKDKRA